MTIGNILIWPAEKATKEETVHTPESARQLVKDSPLISTLISSALGSIRREMDTLMLRCAMSPAIREQQDEFNVITNTRGQMLVGQFGSFITQFLEIWKGTIEEGEQILWLPFGRSNSSIGDVFVTNDVYMIDGAVSHLNDVIVLLPIFYNHDLIGWVCNIKIEPSSMLIISGGQLRTFDRRPRQSSRLYGRLYCFAFTGQPESLTFC